ncbi:MAG: YaiI/YqxD family protein [Paracoccaceae bacterium]
MVKIYVDADACPVRNEVERIATRHKLETYMVCDGGIRPPLNSLIKVIVVNQSPDAADNWIADHIGRTDICVTNDIPLAGRCLKEGAFAIKPNGNTYTNDNIGMALATRKIMEEIRESGQINLGPPPFTKANRSKFLDQMEVIVQKAKKC